MCEKKKAETSMLPGQGELIADVRKIAVLRANALGDFIFVLPALDALRSAYPCAEIVLLAKQWHANFLACRPGPVDRVVVIPPYAGVTEEEDYKDNQRELHCFFAAMREERFDIAVQAHGGGRHSNAFLTQLGARVTVGLKTPDALPLDRWIPYIYFQHEILRYLEVVSLVGASPTVLEPRIALLKRDICESLRVVPEEKGRLLVALHPGAGDAGRRWPPEKFAAVGDELAKRGAHIVVTGTAGEQCLADAVVAAMRCQAQNVCGQLSLGGLAALLSRCRVLVSNDSGPLHLAGAVGTATVGIFWCFNLINAGPLTRLCHRPFVSWQLHCPVCGADRSQTTCSHHTSFVADIPVEEVMGAALELFSQCGC